MKKITPIVIMIIIIIAGIIGNYLVKKDEKNENNGSGGFEGIGLYYSLDSSPINIDKFNLSTSDKSQFSFSNISLIYEIHELDIKIIFPYIYSDEGLKMIDNTYFEGMPAIDEKYLKIEHKYNFTISYKIESINKNISEMNILNGYEYVKGWFKLNHPYYLEMDFDQEYSDLIFKYNSMKYFIYLPNEQKYVFWSMVVVD